MNFDGEEVVEDERTAGVWREGNGGGGWRVAEVTLLIYDFFKLSLTAEDLGVYAQPWRGGKGGGGWAAKEKRWSRSCDL